MKTTFQLLLAASLILIPYIGLADARGVIERPNIGLADARGVLGRPNCCCKTAYSTNDINAENMPKISTPSQVAR